MATATAQPSQPPDLAEVWAAARPGVRARARWELLARPEQLTPEGRWNVWLYLAGRGAGKTRSAAEDMAYYALTHPGARLAVVAPTYADARDTCIEGESGILACLPREEVEVWNRSLGELVLTNGTRLKLFSGDEPDRLRGPQHERAWCDELAAFRYSETWDMLMMGLRLGDRPQAVVTTTPRPSSLLMGLVKRKDVTVTRGSTFDNAANLAPSALESLRRRYEGTRLGRQELHGELLGEAEGALWQRDWIERSRVSHGPKKGYRVMVLGLDPSDGTEEGAEQGSCLAGLGWDNQLYVVASAGHRQTMRQWLSYAITEAHENQASIVVEKNHGGAALVELLEQVMKQIGLRVSYRVVTASQGKITRAEPVALLYEQDPSHIHHVGVHAELEDQLCNAVPGQRSGPMDRLDALVWAVVELLGYSNYGDFRPPSSEEKAVPYKDATDREQPLERAVPWR